jgi:hypothetical protein
VDLHPPFAYPRRRTLQQAVEASATRILARSLSSLRILALSFRARIHALHAHSATAGDGVRGFYFFSRFSTENAGKAENRVKRSVSSPIFHTATSIHVKLLH